MSDERRRVGHRRRDRCRGPIRMNDALKDRLKHVPVLGPLTRGRLSLYRKATFPGLVGLLGGTLRGRRHLGPGLVRARSRPSRPRCSTGWCASSACESVVELGLRRRRPARARPVSRATSGLDVSPHAIQHCVERFPDDPTKSFFRYDPECFHDEAGVFRADLALSLDVIYHLTEDAVFERYMGHLFGAGDAAGGHLLERRRPSVAPRPTSASGGSRRWIAARRAALGAGPARPQPLPGHRGRSHRVAL